jgi:serine protease
MRFRTYRLAVAMLFLPAIVACSTASHVAAVPLGQAVAGTSSDCADAIPGEYIVRLRGTADFPVFQRDLAQFFNLDVGVRSFDALDRFVRPLNSSKTLLLLDGLPDDGERKFLESPTRTYIRYYEPNAQTTLFLTPTDGDFSAQCGLKAIRAEAAWDYADPTKAGGVTVALIDTGAFLKHTDLPAMSVRDDDPDGHGTHLAGIIGALEGNGGTVGVVWTVSLSAYQYSTSIIGDLAKAIEKIELALPTNPNIIVMAWGTSCPSPTLSEEISTHPGTLFVAAAGNNRTDLNVSPIYPAAFGGANLMSVMATACDDTVPDFTSYGKGRVDIAAPGSSALSDTCAEDCDGLCPHGILSTVRNNRHCCMKGTSMSTAFVAGAAALVWSHQSSPTAAGVKQCLVDSAVPLSVLGNKCNCGRLDLRNAVDPAIRKDSCK